MFRRLGESLNFGSNGDVFINSKLGIGTYQTRENIDNDISGVTIFNGNVGVGTTSPSTTLHISNQLRLSNNRYSYESPLSMDDRVIHFFKYTAAEGSSPPSPFFIRVFGTVQSADACAHLDVVFSGTSTGVLTKRASMRGAVSTAFQLRFYKHVSDHSFMGYIVMSDLPSSMAYSLNFETSHVNGYDTFTYDDAAIIDTTLYSIYWNAHEHFDAVVDDNNLMGIGTSLPLAKLHVANASSAALRLQGTTSEHPILEITRTSSTTPYVTVNQLAYIGIGTTQPSSALHIQNQDLKVMSGNVGIGTLHPQESFHVYNNAQIDGLLYASKIAGNVGIGTTIAPHTLHVHGEAYATTTFGQNVGILEGNAFRVYPNMDPIQNDASKLIEVADNQVHIWTPGTDPMPSEKVSIMPTGNVGIGTTAPMSKLHVIGSEIVSQTLGIGTSIARATLHVGGDTLVEGHILPSQCNIYNLGSPEARFKDLYISDATIDINGLELKSLTGNTLYVVGNQLQTFPSATQTFAYTSTSNIEYPPPVPLLAFELDNAISPIQSIHSETYGVYAAINGQDEQSEYRVWANSIRNYGEVNEQSPYFAFDQNPNTRWESIVSLQYGQDPSGPFTTPTLTIQLPAPIVLYTYAITIRADAGYLGQSPMKWRVYGLVSVGATPTLIETRTLPSESWSHPGETRIFLNATPSPSSFPIYQFEFLQTVGTNSVSIANITLYARHVFDINVEHHDHVRKLIHSSGNFTEHSIETILSPSLELPTTNMAVRLEASSFNKYADASASTPVQIRTWNSAFCYATPESQLPMLHVNGGYNNGAFIDLISESGHFIHLPVFQLTSSFIITAFFKFVGTPGPLFDLGNGVLDNNVVLSLKENNHLELAIYNGASLTHTITSLEVELSNEWILITVLADSETIKIAQTTAEGSKIIANSVVLQPIPVIPRKAARVGASHIASSTGTTGTSMQLGAFYIFTDSIPDYQLVLIYKYIWDAGKATRTTTDAGLRTFIESNRLSSFASEQLATSTTPSKYHFTYPNGFVSLDQKHHGNITFSDTVTVGKDVEIHGHMMSSNVTVVGTLTTSNLNVLNQFYYNYDSEMVRTNLQAQPITRTLQVTSDTMQSQEFLIDGIFTFSPNKAHVCVNGIKLAYLSSSNHDYNVTYNIAYDQAKTLVTVALMQPIYRGDVFDVTLWPELLYEDSELRPGLLTQNIEINPSQWLLQLSTSNLTFSGNVGIGRRLDVGQGLAAVSEDALVRLNLQQPWAFRPYENQLQFFAEEFGTAFSIVNSLNENIATFASRGYESINLNGVGIGTTVPIQPLHVHGASFLNGNVGIGTAQATHALHVHGHVKANDIYAEKVFSKNSFATLSDLPSATQYPGMFAYVVGESNAYVAAVDSWKTIAPDVATVPTPTPAAPVIHASWTFASGSGTSYSVTGSGITPDNTENPTFYVVRGLRYSWTNATASHPVELVMDDGSPILATTLLTSSGATSSIASEGETLTFEIPLNAPTGNTYRYKCTVHAPMTGVLSVV